VFEGTFRAFEKSLHRCDENIRIIDICQPREINDGNLIDKREYAPTITYFSLSDEAKSIMQHLEELNESYVFCKIWNRECPIGCKIVQTRKTEDEGDDEIGLFAFHLYNDIEKNAANELALLSEIVIQVWEQSISYWTSYCNSLEDGSITIKQINAIFGSLQKDNSRISAEVGKMCVQEDVKEKRLAQITSYYKCSKYQKGAKLILEASEVLELTQDFSDLKAFVSMVSYICHTHTHTYKKN